MEQKAVLNPNGMSDKNLLGKYQSNSPTPSGEKVQQEQIPKLVETYKAIEQKTSTRLKIYDRHGNFDLYKYSHLLEVSFRDGNLTITTTTRAFIFTGENLHRIAELLGDEQIKSMKEFNPDKHIAPKEQNAILIKTIERSE